MALTYLSNLVDPEVMADIVSATLPQKIKFSPIARIDTTLAGQPGSTIKVPKYSYIGDAETVAEGIAIGTTVLTASTDTATIQKAGKAVELTDESLLSGYGSPRTEAAKQIAMSIAAKVDNDCYDALCGATLVYDGSAADISYDTVVDANAVFEDEVDGALAKILFIHPAQEATIRKDDDFMDKNKYGLEVVMNGTIGSIAGCHVVKSKKVKKVEYTIKAATDTGFTEVTNANKATYVGKIGVNADGAFVPVKVGDFVKALTNDFYACPIVVVDAQDPNEDPAADSVATSESALTIYMKRDVLLEADRDVLKRTHVLAADEHYVAVLSNESKVVLAKFGA